MSTPPEPERIRRMFAAVARRYDLANTVLSCGVHHRWRRRFVRWCGARPGAAVLDAGAGTGDLAVAFRRLVSPVRVVALDFCAAMLRRARPKTARAGGGVHLLLGDVRRLPFPDGVFDLAAVAFGIRNVDDPVAGLAELARVTRPGGTVGVLEFGRVVVPGLRRLYGLYRGFVLPRLGGWLTGDRGAYEYLRDSAAAFPCGDAFLDLLAATGRLTAPAAAPLTGGVAWMYRARRR